MAETTSTAVEGAEFGTRELLYMRYQKAYWISGVFSSTGIQSTNPSFNREKFSVPSDVLTDGNDSYPRWGVLSCGVHQIPTEVLSGDNVAFDFFPRYDPLEHNRAHSVIAHKPKTDQKPPGRVRKLVRLLLGQAMMVQIAAEV
jgi:hypothetical protein